MKTLRLILIALAVAGAGAFIACNDSGTSPIGVSAPTNLQGVSMTSQSVGIRWSNDGFSHTVTWSPTSGGTSNSATVGKDTNTVIVSGLIPATEYTFSVTSSDGSTTSSASSINWAPASRFDANDQVSGGYKIYLSSVSGAGFPSGLVIANPPHRQPIGTGASGKEQTDLVFMDRGNGWYQLIDPRKTADPTLLDTTRFVNVGSGAVATPATGLNDDYRSSPYAASTYSDTAYTVTSSAVEKGKIIYLRVQDISNNNYYSRVYIRRQSNGSLLGDDGDGKKYVQLDVSFQDNKALLYGKANKETKPGADESLR